jgi:hypothetical protein
MKCAPPRSRRRQRSVKPYDATTKFLFDLDLAAWLAVSGLRVNGPVSVVDTDLATIQATVDRVAPVAGEPPWLAHVELQASAEATLLSRLQQYNSMLHHRYSEPVRTVLFLLRRAADSPTVTGRYRVVDGEGELVSDLHYRVVRVWELPLERLLAGPLAWLPLAPLSEMGPTPLTEVVVEIDRRLNREAGPAEAAELWTAVYLLAGLRYTDAECGPLLQRVRTMRESATYQAILAEGRAEGEARGVARGRVEEARRLVQLLGNRRFGDQDETAARELARLNELERIERMTARLLEATSWEDLLGTP